MNFRQKITLSLLLTIVLGSVAFAEVVHIPDSNLRMAVHEALNIATDLPLDRTDLTRLARLNAYERGVTNLSGLEFAQSLEHLSIWGNPISDLAPIASLRKLKGLNAAKCQIADLGPLSHLSHLEWVDLRENQIVDVEPLATLPELKWLNLDHNQIVDVDPLARCPQLSTLHILNNPAINYTSLLAQPFEELVYDAVCDMSPLPLGERINGRSYPSVFAAWGGIVNRDELQWVDNITHHDMWFRPANIMRYSRSRNAIVGNTAAARRERQELLSKNPYFIRLFEITVPITPGWERDVIQAAIAVSKCGLYDGLFFDHWDDIEGEPDAWFEPMLNIVRAIRANTRPDFLILGNVNRHTIPRSADYINGGFMETLSPSIDDREGGRVQVENGLVEIEGTLSWLETNLREPRINALEGWGFPDEPPDSRRNLRWMRAITTMSLTYSDGYFLFSKFISNHHNWYDFWDADLGKPVGPKSQLYDENIPGLYIREYTNGWAVHNHSGEPQVIALPDEVQGVTSSWVGAEHVLPDLDGEIYLRIKPPNPADVNKDGVVNILDLTIIAQAFGTDSLEGDVNGDGVVNVIDLVFVANQF